MPPLDARNSRRGGRARGGPRLGPIEALERREVLSYSGLGYSLPDLTLKGYSGPVTAWGGSLTVTVDVFNRGASSFNEPLNLTQGAPSSADAGPTTIDVYATTRPGGGRAVALGSISVPALPQNDVNVLTQTLALPARPAGFPSNGGRIYLTYVINASGSVLESDYTNNAAVSANSVKIEPALPELKVIGFQTPLPLQPGDTLTPAIEIANLGPVGTSTQGPVTVQLVASQSPNYGPGDAILGTYTVDNIPPLSAVPSPVPVSGDANLVPGSNVITLDSLSITLPAHPGTYYLGVKVDPLHQIIQLTPHNSPRFDAFVKVGPPIAGLPPAGLLPSTTPGTAGTPYEFPIPLIGGATNPTTTTGTTTTPPLLLYQTSPVIRPSSGGGGVVVVNGKPVSAIGSPQALAVRGIFRGRTAIFNSISRPAIAEGPTSFNNLDTSSQTGQRVFFQSGFPTLSNSPVATLNDGINAVARRTL